MSCRLRIGQGLHSTRSCERERLQMLQLSGHLAAIVHCCGRTAGGRRRLGAAAISLPYFAASPESRMIFPQRVCSSRTYAA
jgi:hypothetical protein